MERYNGVFYYELHYNPIYDEHKKVLGASLFMENITSRMLAEIQLKEAEAHLSSLINDTADGIMAINKDYNVLVFNEVYQQQFKENGYYLETNRSIFDFMPAYVQNNWKTLYDRALAGERFVKVIGRGKFPDKMYEELWFNPIRNDKEEVMALSIFSRDITETKLSDLKVRQLLLESLETAENFRVKENEMSQKMLEYQKKIAELEAKLAVEEQAKKNTEDVYRMYSDLIRKNTGQ
jgi:PAS domain S-box-containing protein